VESDACCTQEDVESVRKDAAYIVEAANSYPKMLDLLQRLEATCADPETTNKIKTFLIEEGHWSE
jgi:hypothetical protein